MNQATVMCVLYRIADLDPNANFTDVAVVTPNEVGPFGGKYSHSLLNPFPHGLTQPAGSSLGPLSNLGQGANGDMWHFKTPRTYQYSLGFQRALPKNMMIDVSFAGNYALYDRDGASLGHPQDALGYTEQQIAMSDPTIFSDLMAH